MIAVRQGIGRFKSDDRLLHESHRRYLRASPEVTLGDASTQIATCWTEIVQLRTDLLKTGLLPGSIVCGRQHSALQRDSLFRRETEWPVGHSAYGPPDGSLQRESQFHPANGPPS